LMICFFLFCFGRRRYPLVFFIDFKLIFFLSIISNQHKLRREYG
jgi:hypothetical protein